MRNISGICALLFLMVSHGVSADSAAMPSVQALSAWTNQSGSTLYLDAIDPEGQISGHYINRAAGYGCQNISYPVTGWVYGTAITFTTLWQSTTESCNSITAWTGFYYQGQITTLWQLVINRSTVPGQIVQGSDVFKQTAKSDKKSLLPSKSP